MNKWKFILSLFVGIIFTIYGVIDHLQWQYFLFSCIGAPLIVWIELEIIFWHIRKQ